MGLCDVMEDLVDLMMGGRDVEGNTEWSFEMDSADLWRHEPEGGIDFKVLMLLVGEAGMDRSVL